MFDTLNCYIYVVNIRLKTNSSVGILMRCFKHFYRLSLIAILMILPFTVNSAVNAAEEYEIKAVYLFNLGSFIYWPDAEMDKAEKFHICVLGQDPFGNNLDFVAQEINTVQKRPVLLHRVQNVSQTQACHVVFIGESEQLRLSYILQQLQNKPILTVSDMERFVVEGGMVQFYQRDGKIRLMLDPQAFTEAGLKASSHLMRIAKLVKQ